MVDTAVRHEGDVDAAGPGADGHGIGASVRRREDDRLLRGRGLFVDDIDLPGMLHAAIARSPLAHARVGRVDAAEAMKVDGVVGVYSLADLPELAARPIPPKVPRPGLQPGERYPLAKDRVRFVGEPIAVVVAHSRAAAEDACELLDIELDPLSPCPSLQRSLADDAERIHDDVEDNTAIVITQRVADADAALAAAPHTVAERFEVHRGGSHSMECRGLVVRYDAAIDELTLWDATQSQHYVRSVLGLLLDRDEATIRVVVPRDVGGGFGPKAAFYGEEAALAAIAIRLARPVKWVEDRQEHFISAVMERGQIHDVQVGFDDDGRLLALKDTFYHDQGAYCIGLQVPLITASTLPGPYVIPAIHTDMVSVFTNMPPTGSVRGAGRPQAVFVMERMIDRVAETLGMEPAEVRRRNLIPADAFPYDGGLTFRDGSAMTYDSGNYQALLDGALERIDVGEFRREQRRARDEGRRIGLGLGMYVEGTGLGPFETAIARVTERGTITVSLAAPAQGQGFETVFAQIASEALGVDYDLVTIDTGDTAVVPTGHGTFASRVTAVGGPAVWIAGQRLRERILHAAAAMRGRDMVDLDLDGDRVVEAGGEREVVITLRELARQCNIGTPGVTFPEGLEPHLEVRASFTTSGSAYSSGIHACIVEVDVDTGEVELLRYVIGHDCGTVINPLLVDGQTVGGLAHGIGNALLERMHYDDAGQPTTTSFLDYALPAAENMPQAEMFHVVSPSPLNPLGAKGAGEGGTLPAPAAIGNAVQDALSDLGVRISTFPLTPSVLSDLIAEHTGHPDGSPR